MYINLLCRKSNNFPGTLLNNKSFYVQKENRAYKLQVREGMSKFLNLNLNSTEEFLSRDIQENRRVP
jgi:hypothetical protein